MKKTLALLLAVVMVLSLCACGAQPAQQPAGDKPADKPADQPAADENPLAGTFDITVWVAENIVDLTAKQIADFNASNTDGIVINATIEPVSESDAATNMITDVEAGGDIFCFAQDQFARLVQAGALSKLGVQAAQIVSEANDAGVVSAASVSNELFAYPLTSDNGYFMYYDKSVIPEEDLGSLEALIADCEEANRYFVFEMETSAWYAASFFFATGCVSEWETDSDGAFVGVNDTFNSPEGLIAVKGMQKLVNSPMHVNASTVSEFANDAAIVVSGTWDFVAASDILGDNMGVAELPSFDVDGTSYHLGSFNGCKLMGVKPQTDAVKSAVLHKLAQYLTGEACQMERFDAVAWGPANLNAQSSEAVKANPGLVALFAQNEYSIPQGQIHGSWWDIAKVIATDVKAATDDAGLQTALDNYTDKINAIFSMDDSTKNAFTVIGAIGGANWDKDFEMTEENGVWTSVDAFELAAGAEFKVRQGLSWDVAYGSEAGVFENAPNFIVETAGTYYIQLDTNTGVITLVEA